MKWQQGRLSLYIVAQVVPLTKLGGSEHSIGAWYTYENWGSLSHENTNCWEG